MRLLKRNHANEYCLTEHLTKHELPRYAILSHTWGQESEEVTFQDLTEGSASAKACYNKIQFCGEQAAQDNLDYFWVDSCCIKRSDSQELSEAINSMFRWYGRAAKCYVYLSDVLVGEDDVQQLQPKWEAAFRASRWFTRGWTLQELLAPRSVEFYSSEGKRLGDRESLKLQIQEITGINAQALQRSPLSGFSIEERTSWASRRVTKLEEDKVYSLLGIVGVSMAPIYGEGKENAFRRLQNEIHRPAQKIDHIEPTSKRRKIGPHDPRNDSPYPPVTRDDLIKSLYFDQIEDRFINIRPRHSKTCKWFLESREYLDWLSPQKLSDHHGFFWIKGKPGCGKSTLTKFAFIEIKKSSQDSVFLSFFFNARGTILERSTIGLYRSLLVQLLAIHEGNQHVRRVPSLSLQTLDNQLKTNRELLKDLLAQTLQSIDQQKLVVVIDALDECDEDEVRDMVAFFERLGADAVADERSFRVIFSSRHYPYITIKRSVEIKLEDQQGHSQDIDKYLSSELKGGRGKQAEQIRQEIRERASGVFMWVVLVVQILNKAFDHGQTYARRKKLQEIPDDLNELFRSILTRDCHNMNEMKLCLQWILHANRPMKREELYFAVLSGVEPNESFPWDQDEISTETIDKFILSSSKGLAEVTKSKDHVVQFIHESVRDYLLKENGLSQVWSDLTTNTIGINQDCLKGCCWNYIRSSISGLMDDCRSLPRAKSLQAAKPRKDTVLRLPFLEYAVLNIFTHADIAHAEGVTQRDFIAKFQLSDWVCLNNIFEKYGIRRLPSTIDLLYLFVERRCYNLIDLVKRDGLYGHGSTGRYGNPIFAAIANDDQRAFEALVPGGNEMQPYSRTFPYPCDKICSFLVKYGKPTLTDRFLSIYDIDVNDMVKNGELLLIRAAQYGHERTVELFLRRGADVNAQGELYGNVLQAASVEGHEKIIKLLLSQGADVNAQGGFFGNALQAAAASGNKKVIVLLLDRGADVDASGGFFGNALQAAAARGNEKVIELLLDRGADVDAQGGYWGNALQAALVKGHEKVVELLLSRGTDINAQGGLYSNALQAASFYEHKKVVELLLSRGAKTIVSELSSCFDITR